MGVATSTRCREVGPHGQEEGPEPTDVLPINSAFFSIYSSGCAANPPRRAPYPLNLQLQTILKGKRGSKLLVDSTSALSAELAAGAEVLWLGEGGWRWVSAGGKGVSVQGLPEVEHVPGGFGKRNRVQR